MVGRFGLVVALTVLAMSCGGTDVADEPGTAGVDGSNSTSTTVLAAVEDDAGAEGADAESPTTEYDERQPLVQTNEFSPLAPGLYESMVLPLRLEMETTTEFNVAGLLPGKIVISPLNDMEAYVGLVAVDTLIDSDASGRQRSRLPATPDLSAFLESRDGVEVLESRRGELGGMPAHVWRIAYLDECSGCDFELLFNVTGWQNSWGTAPGWVVEIWTIETPAEPIVVMVGARQSEEHEFDDWADYVQRELFDEFRFGEPTGFSLRDPTAAPFDTGFGEYAIGRMETQFVDSSRTTIEVLGDTGDVTIPAASDRQLLIGVSYPSESGGFGAAAADGQHPVVIVAHALFDAGLPLPADRQLASHGYVVVSVRFPESSFPGNAQAGVPHQPGDVSFVIDQIEQGALGAEFSAVIDTERVGVVGHSAGGTTALGLLAYDCCYDGRIDAIITHGSTVYDFESERVPSTAAVLHQVSDADIVAAASSMRDFHLATEGPSAVATLEHDSHLGWLKPGAHSYDDSFALSLEFFDMWLKDEPGDLAGLVADSAFIELIEN